mmetsp:Transcript_9887/g.20440  ORF Transcript_9887/g.20440 Transcript_9887/m.20440 type:complete len:170 (-) Transcript_9887:518-1027(-)
MCAFRHRKQLGLNCFEKNTGLENVHRLNPSSSLINLLQRDVANLDTFGKEVSGLCGVFRGNKGTGELFNDTNTRCVSLEDQTEEGDHCQTSMLDFLQLLFGIFFGTVVKSQRIPASFTLSPLLGVTGLVAVAFFKDDVDATEFQNSHEGEDLEKGGTGGLSEGLKGVGV